MDKTVKNVLAAVGAVAVVKAAPVLALGAAIGVAASNPDKVKKAMEDAKVKVEDLVARAEAAVEEELAKHNPEDECECCCGGECYCEGECCCDTEEENTSWEDEVPVEEEPAPEVEPESTPVLEDKLENLRAKAEDFLAALKDLKN